jgi:hypothetical protein
MSLKNLDIGVYLRASPSPASPPLKGGERKRLPSPLVGEG